MPSAEGTAWTTWGLAPPPTTLPSPLSPLLSWVLMGQGKLDVIIILLPFPMAERTKCGTHIQ